MIILSDFRAEGAGVRRIKQEWQSVPFGDQTLLYDWGMREVEGSLAANIWDRVIGADDHVLSPDEARALLRWRFPESDRKRVDELSQKAREGRLSAVEQRELDEYLAIESALISLKSKARLALKLP